MDTDIDTKHTRRTAVRGMSLRIDQLDWLTQEAEAQRHGNVSRIVQDAIDAYRDVIEVRRIRAGESGRVA